MPPAATGPLDRFYRRRFRVAVLLFFVYICYYFGRVTVPVALPVIGDAFQFSSTETGLILSVYFGVYTIAKAANGLLGDRVGGRVLLLVGIVGSAACNAAFGFGRELLFFVLVWSANAYFQSMGWLAVMPIMAHWYRPRESGRAMGIFSLSYQLGDFLTRSSAAFLIVALGWSGLFWAHAALFAVIALVLASFVKSSPRAAGLPDVHDPGFGAGAAVSPAAAPLDEESRRLEVRRWRRRVLANRSYWILCLSFLFLSIIRYAFWGWSVDYLVRGGAGVGLAAITSAVFPLLGSAGSITTGLISDRMGARRGPILVVMGLLLSGSIYLFSRIPGDESGWLAVALGLVGFSLYGPYSLMSGAVIMDLGWKHATATASGFLDAIGAGGAIVTGVGMGYLIDTYGWDIAFSIIIGLALVSTALNATLWRLKPLHSPGG